MKLKEIVTPSFKSLGREIGLDVSVVGGRLHTTPQPSFLLHHTSDFILPSMAMVNACRADDFDFFQSFLDSGMLTVEQMHRAAKRYHLGKTKSGQPIFWMIDDMLNPLDAHIGSDRWISALLKAREPLLECWCVRHCLFGLHLTSAINHHPSPVCIVESEVSAVILSELFPESLWLAYVSESHLTPDLLAPLQGRAVTLFPRTNDTMSTYLFFLDYAQQVQCLYPIRIHVDDTLERHASPEQKARCIDILDFIAPLPL